MKQNDRIINLVPDHIPSDEEVAEFREKFEALHTVRKCPDCPAWRDQCALWLILLVASNLCWIALFVAHSTVWK